ncbi:MAG: hypothetical protein ACOC8L_02730 [Spirochaetota bacterium]
MGGMIIVSVLLLIAIGSLISGLVLWLLARSIGKIETAAFGNSFLVALLASVAVYLVYFIIAAVAMGSPMEFLMLFGDMGFVGGLILSIVIMAAAYIPIGKVFWKTSWVKSAITNGIWIVIYSILQLLLLNTMA